LNLILILTGLLVTYVGFLLWKGNATSR